RGSPANLPGRRRVRGRGRRGPGVAREDLRGGGVAAADGALTRRAAGIGQRTARALQGPARVALRGGVAAECDGKGDQARGGGAISLAAMPSRSAATPASVPPAPAPLPRRAGAPRSASRRAARRDRGRMAPTRRVIP